MTLLIRINKQFDIKYYYFYLVLLVITIPICNLVTHAGSCTFDIRTKFSSLFVIFLLCVSFRGARIPVAHYKLKLTKSRSTPTLRKQIRSSQIFKFITSFENTKSFTIHRRMKTFLPFEHQPSRGQQNDSHHQIEYRHYHSDKSHDKVMT